MQLTDGGWYDADAITGESLNNGCFLQYKRFTKTTRLADLVDDVLSVDYGYATPETPRVAKTHTLRVTLLGIVVPEGDIKETLFDNTSSRPRSVGHYFAVVRSAGGWIVFDAAPREGAAGPQPRSRPRRCCVRGKDSKCSSASTEREPSPALAPFHVTCARLRKNLYEDGAAVGRNSDSVL